MKPEDGARLDAAAHELAMHSPPLSDKVIAEAAEILAAHTSERTPEEAERIQRERAAKEAADREARRANPALDPATYTFYVEGHEDGGINVVSPTPEVEARRQEKAVEGLCDWFYNCTRPATPGLFVRHPTHGRIPVCTECSKHVSGDAKVVRTRRKSAAHRG